MMSNDQPIPIEVFMMRYFVKYHRLDQLIPYAFTGSTSNNLNIFIDIYGIYRGMFSRSYKTDISDYTSFTSMLINMCIHYRTYFKMLGVSTTIYLISSYNISEINTKFVADYNKTFRDKLNNKMIRDMVEQNVELLKIICPYLPNIHFVHSEFESSVSMLHIINKNVGTPNLIISSDLYPIQLTNICPDTAYLKPKKSMGEDVSDIVCPNSHLEHEKTFWRGICQEKEDFTLNESKVLISSRNYVLLAALNRFTDRNLKAIVNFNRANSILKNIVGFENVKIYPITLNTLDINVLGNVPVQTVDSRFKVLDVEYQYELYLESVEPLLLQFDNLSDPDAINIINDTYFSKNPINILNIE